MTTGAESNEKPGVYMGPYAGVDYTLTFCPLQSRLKHIYHWQPYMPESTYGRGNFIPKSGTSDLASGATMSIFVCLEIRLLTQLYLIFTIYSLSFSKVVFTIFYVVY
jgi:hypothetical protein